MDAPQPLGNFERQLNGLQLAVCKQLPAKEQVSSKVTERHHREPVTGEGVVGVVPFGALGVHPDSAVDHQVRELGENRNQQLFGERNVIDLTVIGAKQLCI